MGDSLQKITETNFNAEEEEDEKHHQAQSPDQLDNNGGTLTCEICIEPIAHPNQLFNSVTNCTHPYCTECIIKYIQVKIEDNSTEIPCPALNCPNFLNPLHCHNLIPRQLFEKWCDLLCESAVLGLDSCYCPNPECSSLILNECGGAAVKRAACPKCKTALCFKCKMRWHAGYRCRDSRELRDANDIAFGVLAERRKWKSCPSCSRYVERVYGCNSVRCRCGIYFCYGCGKRVCRCQVRPCRPACCCVFLIHVLGCAIFWFLLLYFQK